MDSQSQSCVSGSKTNGIQEQKIVSSQTEDPNLSPLSRYKKMYYEQIGENINRFKMTRGEFTDFIQKNNRYKSVGPLHGQQRTMERIQNTKKSVWLKSNSFFSDQNTMNSTDFGGYKNTKFGSLYRNQSNISENSKLISEKGRIRDNRQRLNASFQKGIQDRKKTTCLKNQLPKLQSQSIFNSLHNQNRKILPFTSKKYIDESTSFEIQDFEQKLKKQFKR